MFRSNQLGTTNGIPAAGNADQFTNGGGPAFVNNVFQGTDSAAAARRTAAGQFAASKPDAQRHVHRTEPRSATIEALQRVSRASDGTPLHIRDDGPGLDGMDVPAFRSFPANGDRSPAGSASSSSSS